MSDAPATPRPAATILLLRHGGTSDAEPDRAKRNRAAVEAPGSGDRGVEVLLVRRSTEASFMPGVWVFPGGVIEAGESPVECAARELAEEASIELGDDAELVAWSRWITPEVVPMRFDTHFFVALAGAHAAPKADGAEVTDAAWFEPRAALDSHAAGELELVFPTIKTLETLLEHDTAEQVIEAARNREVEPILPRVAGTRATPVVLLPWEDGYEAAESSVDRLPP